MKLIITLLIVLLFPLVAFGNESEMKCKKIPVKLEDESQLSRLYRCENFEIICYMTEESIQCNFKERPPEIDTTSKLMCDEMIQEMSVNPKSYSAELKRNIEDTCKFK